VIARLCGVLAAFAVLVALGGCGDDAQPPAPRDVTLALDFAPNAAQAPVFSAAREGLDRREGTRLRIRQPGQGPDGVKLVVAGRAQLALLDIQDLPIARKQGADIVAIGALIGRPLGALIAQPGVRRPRDLEHKAVGVSGLPSDPAFLRAVVEADGGDARTVRQVLIGFNGVQRMLTHRVDAVPAFWNIEGVALRARGRPVRIFKVDDYGAPPYPEVVIVTSRKTLDARRADLVAALAAISAGVAATRAHPQATVKQVAAAAGSADPALVRAQLDAVSPTFVSDLHLDRAVLERWAAWVAKVGLVRPRPDVDEAFAFDLAGS